MYQNTNLLFTCLRRPEMSRSTSTVRCDLNVLFPKLSRHFLTKIDWLLQSHGSIGRFEWFINPTP